MTITSSARIERIIFKYHDAFLQHGDDFDSVVAAIEATMPDADIDEIALAIKTFATSFENWAKVKRKKAERCVTDISAIEETEAEQINPWTEAFYDRDYGRDQTRRMPIYDSVVDFLLSIDCRVSWTVGYDGDFNGDYGLIISSVTYQGKKFEHFPFFQIRYELPAELTEKLDAKFGTQPSAK
jgi:hypothetical protein